jgi:hypothetical protein
MARNISGFLACAVAVFLCVADTALGEDMMKQDLSGMLGTPASKGGTNSAGDAKVDCMQKAEKETDSTKKSEMLKACDAMK